MVIFQVINNIALDTKGGGAESFAIRLTNELNKAHECHLIVVWKYGTIEEQRIVDSLIKRDQVHFLSEIKDKRVPRLFVLCKRFFSLIKQYSPVIINSHSVLPDVLSCIVALFKRGNHIIVRTMHTDKKWIDNLLLEKFLISCIFPVFFNCEVSISKATKERLDNRYLSKSTKKSSPLIYNGISSDNENYYLKRKLSYSKNNTLAVRIISVGRLTEQKGYHFLLTAINLLKEKRKVELDIIGDGPLRNKLEQQAQSLGLAQKVNLLGYRTDVLELMSGADIFISSSLWEGFPTVILEAMTIGIPVIATDIPGTRELIDNGNTGILVPVENPEAMAKAVSYLISNPDVAERLVINAKENVSPYSMEAVAHDYESLYQSLALSTKQVFTGDL